MDDPLGGARVVAYGCLGVLLVLLVLLAPLVFVTVLMR